MGRRLLLLFLLLGLLLMPIGTAATYDISTNEMVDIPDRERTVDGKTFDITHISQIEQNNTLTVDTTGPDSRYEVNLISPEGQYVRVENVPEGEDATVDFDMSRTPGSWLVTITDPSTLVAIHPVIIKAYDVEPDVSETTVTSGTDVTANITVTEPDGGVSEQKDINRVEAVLANGSTEIRVTAESVEGEPNTYQASISTDGLAAGSYEFFSVVRGEQDIRGRDEVLGISSITDVTVEAPDTDTTTPSNGDDTNGGNGDDTDSGSDTDDGSDSGTTGGTDGSDTSAGSSTDSTGTSTADSDGETGSLSVFSQDGGETAAVTTQRVSDSSVAADITRNESTASADSQSMVATVPTNVSSDSGAVTSNTLRIESQPVTAYSAAVSVQDSTPTGPSSAAIGTIRVNHTIAEANVTRVAFNVTIDRSRLRTSDLSAAEVALYRQHDGSWTRLTTKPVSETSRTVTIHATAPGLSTFVLAAEQARAAEITDVALSTTTLTTAETATVDATVENPTNETETYPVQFAVGDRVTNQSVTVGAGNDTTVSHRITDLPATARTHAVYVNGMYAGSITRSDAPTGDQTTTTATPDSTTVHTTTPTSATTDESVITPTDTSAAPGTTTTSAPGFTPALLIVTLLSLVVLALGRP